MYFLIPTLILFLLKNKMSLIENDTTEVAYVFGILVNIK